jgi:hypothetical protein
MRTDGLTDAQIRPPYHAYIYYVFRATNAWIFVSIFVCRLTIAEGQALG